MRFSGRAIGNKYHAKKTTFRGETFDSKREAERYAQLLLLQRTGAIENLKRQVPFTLIPAQRIDGRVVERACVYRADFVYQQDGETIVEDTKGVRTPDYIIKRKLMLYVHGVRVKEV